MTFGTSGSLLKEDDVLDTEENGLEKRSRELLKRIISKGENSDSFRVNLNKLKKEIQYLVDNKYVLKKDSESLKYKVTLKGKEYVTD